MHTLDVFIIAILLAQCGHLAESAIVIKCLNARNCAQTLPSCNPSRCIKLPVFPADVTEIHISRATILNIQADAFANLPNLRQIKITDSTIKSIRQHAFRDLSDLQSIELSSSEIDVIEGFAFQRLWNISLVSITKCYVGYIQQQAFVSLRHIKKFTFSETLNPQTFGFNTFTDIRNVENVSICHHTITRIDYHAISDMDVTDEFEFCNNTLDILTTASITNIHGKMVFIWLNTFGHVERGTLAPLAWINGEGFQFNNNRFVCDCSERWMLTDPDVMLHLHKNVCYDKKLGLRLQQMHRLTLIDLGNCNATTTMTPPSRIITSPTKPTASPTKTTASPIKTTASPTKTTASRTKATSSTSTFVMSLGLAVPVVVIVHSLLLQSA